ncbi:MAG: trypsin-like peptidase domain-containing protein [Thermoguttaceae bacterium]
MLRVSSTLLVLALSTAAAVAQPVLLDFYADWCQPCQSMAATVDQLAAEGYAVRRVNVAERRDLAEQFGVQSIPCFVWIDSGREVDRVTGVTTIERLRFRSKESKPASVANERTREKTKTKTPTPAWRYERPEGVRKTVVRVECDSQDGRVKGSGVVVRYGNRIVVLTARHVVRSATTVRVKTHTGRAVRCRVLVADEKWDCAILAPTASLDVEPAELEFGVAATMAEGDRFESCGYGPDDRLAANTGLFVGYRRSGADAAHGPDDWFIISGHARPGDSGGPVFSARGRVVGVLWGTDGEQVACVQAGRLHVALADSMRQFHEQACDGRCPTSPMPGPVPEAYDTESSKERDPALAWRRKIEEQERSTAVALGRIDSKLDALGRQPQVASPASQPDPRIEEALRQAQEANAKLDALGKLFSDREKSTAEKTSERATLRERIHEKAEDIKERLDGVLDSPFAKHLAAILGIVFVIGIGTWIAISQHRKAGTKTLVEKGTDALATATAGTPIGTVTNLLDKAVDNLGQRLRDLDAKIDSKVQAVQQQVTQTALATPTAATSSTPTTQS